jgi:hypothetical protein
VPRVVLVALVSALAVAPVAIAPATVPPIAPAVAAEDAVTVPVPTTFTEAVAVPGMPDAPPLLPPVALLVAEIVLACVALVVSLKLRLDEA